jgi:hypothetical protein
MKGYLAKQPQPTGKPAIHGILQRASGQHAAGGECTACQERREGTLQRAAVRPLTSNEAPPIVHEVLNSLGQPLDSVTRAYMEPRFGHDFSQVRVHTGPRAAESAQAVNALAYTVGSDLVFGAGQYTPASGGGRKLLAHELAHVIQQGGSRVAGSSLRIGPPDDAYELTAQHTALTLDSAPAVKPGTASRPAGVVQRIGPAAAVGLAAAGAVAFALGFGGAAAIDYALMDRERSLRFARSMETISPGWLEALPNCPCQAPRADTDNWVTDSNPRLQEAHPGATSSFRSTPAATPGSRHGQQCTYDQNDNLITNGAAAGTPDFYNGSFSSISSIINLPYHWVYDYKTFKELGWETYTQYWRPNNGNGCPVNVI